MLSEKETLQICRRYDIDCPVCGTANAYFRLKRDICRAAQREGDGHPLKYRWGKTGFDSVDPLQFFFGTCQKCMFTSELDDAEFRTASRDLDGFKTGFLAQGLQQLLDRSATGKGIAQSLGKRMVDAEPFARAVAQFHLGIYSECLRLRIVPGSIARYYLRLAWIYRDRELFYPESDIEAIGASLQRVESLWNKGLPPHKDYPARPGLALDEVTALRFSRDFFERNYETLREAKVEEELRLRYLLAEIGFRLYELSSAPEDFQKASSFFSGTMQQCLSIISDKSIVGGLVNRARDTLEKTGERGRELRELHKSRGGDAEEEESAPEASASPKKKAKKATKKAGQKPATKAARAGAGETGDADGAGQGSNGQPDAAAGDGEGEQAQMQPELDRVTRQVTLLQEEVETLRSRLKEAEEDNRKWRQLAGRDALTGLENKTMLFRLVLPKIIKTVSREVPFSCIAVGLDQVAQVNMQHGWVMGDRMLQEAAKGLDQFVEEGEKVYRLDGATFALCGPMDNNVARQRAAVIRRRLAGAIVQVESVHCPLVSSVGVVTVDRATGTSAVEASNAIYEALTRMLYRAKDKGGNAVEAHTLTKF